jgi:hypothetical protein
LQDGGGNTLNELLATIQSENLKKLPDPFVQLLAEWTHDNYLTPEARDALVLAGFARSARQRATAFKDQLIAHLIQERIVDNPQALFGNPGPTVQEDRQAKIHNLRQKIDKTYQDKLKHAHDYLYLLSTKANWASGDSQNKGNPIYARISADFHRYLGEAKVTKGGECISYWQFPIQRRIKDQRPADKQIRDGIDELITATGMHWKHDQKFAKAVCNLAPSKDAEEQTKFAEALAKHWTKLADAADKLNDLQRQLFSLMEAL